MDYVDDLGRTYDAMGTPRAAMFWDEREFLASLDKHLLKGNDFTVVDFTGFSYEQVATVRTYINSLPSEVQEAILMIGP